MNKTATSLADLVAAGLLPAATPELAQAEARLAVAVTPAMLELIDRADPADPIAAQFVPQAQELAITPEERADPIGDAAYSPLSGVVHRYPDRVLLKLLHACPVYCRFCFRREQVGPQGGVLGTAELEAALRYIEQNPAIWEVILSGGDPLMLSDRRLQEVVTRLAAIPHVKLLRIHSRVPVVDPQRVTADLIAALRSRLPVYLLLHCNHPRELTAAARDACARMADSGIVLLSQSVLLRGVNADVETLAALMRAFVENRIKPHYLHHPDLATGTAHFRVSLEEGQALMRALRGRLSGLCQPTYMLDIPGGVGKSPVGPNYATREDAQWRIEDFRGASHVYHDR